MDGVWRTRVGYCGGESLNPTYKNIGGHTETLQIDFDPSVISYAELLKEYWRDHEPDFPAYSTQYMSAVFWHGERQKLLALASRDALENRLGSGLYVRMEEAPRFWLAEDYHQKFYLRRTHWAQQELMQLLGSDEALRDSAAAAKVNGILGGYGRGAGLETQLSELGVSEKGQARLLAQLERRMPGRTTAWGI